MIFLILLFPAFAYAEPVSTAVMASLIASTILKVGGTALATKSKAENIRFRERYKQALQNAQLAILGADTAARKQVILRNAQLTYGRQSSAFSKNRIGQGGTARTALTMAVGEHNRKMDQQTFSYYERAAKLAIHQSSSKIAYEKAFDVGGMFAGIANDIADSVGTYSSYKASLETSLKPTTTTTIPIQGDPSITSPRDVDIQGHYGSVPYNINTLVRTV